MVLSRPTRASLTDARSGLRYTVASRLPTWTREATSMPHAHGLSKSRYVSGLQCHKQLWWRVHEPASPELVPDAALQNVFRHGTRVGEVARGYVPGGVLIDLRTPTPEASSRPHRRQS